MQHYAAASTVYNFGTPQQVEAGLMGLGGGFGQFGQAESRDDWEGRIASAQYAITSAKSVATPTAAMSLSAPEALVVSARATLYAAKKAGEWTQLQEEQVAKELEKARNAFGAAQASNLMSGGGMFPMPFPTWTLAAATLPAGSAGQISPGTLPVEVEVFPTPADVKPGVIPPPPPPLVKRAFLGVGVGVLALVGVGLWWFLGRRR